MKLFLFGSSLTKKNPNDIDVLWVYSRLECSPTDAAMFVRSLESPIVESLKLPVHSVILTDTEEREVAFADDVGAVLLLEFEMNQIRVSDILDALVRVVVCKGAVG